MKYPSGSKLDLAFKCQHPWTSGIQWARKDDEKRNNAAVFGDAVHKVAEHVEGLNVDTKPVADEYALKRRDGQRLEATSQHVAAKLDALVNDGWMLWREVPIAYHVETGIARVMNVKHHRDYRDKRSGELTATVDLIAVRPGEMLVADWKTGKRIERDGLSWQLMLAALSVKALFAREEEDYFCPVTAELWYVREYGLEVEGTVMSSAHIQACTLEIEQLWNMLNCGPTPPKPGTHCTDLWCPIVGECAATRAALAEIANSSEWRIDTIEDAARVWTLLPLAEAAIKSVNQRVRAIAKRQPIPLLDGKKRLAMVEYEQDSIALDDAAYLELLNLIEDHDAISRAVEHKVTKADIDRNFSKEDAAKIFSMLRSRGAMKKSTYTRMSAINVSKE